MMLARPVTPESGKPPPKPLATVIRSGTTPGMLDREHLPGARNAALHFVGNQHDAVLVAQPAQRAQELERRHVEAALSLHRLDHDGCDGLRVDIAVKQPLQVRQRLLDR